MEILKRQNSNATGAIHSGVVGRVLGGAPNKRKCTISVLYLPSAQPSARLAKGYGPVLGCRQKSAYCSWRFEPTPMKTASVDIYRVSCRTSRTLTDADKDEQYQHPVAYSRAYWVVPKAQDLVLSEKRRK